MIPPPPTSTLFPYTTLFRSINAQAPLCINAQPICSDATNSSFPNSINNDIPVGPDYGCLQSISGVNDVNAMVAPQWFYFEVSQSGDIELEIEQYNTTNNPIDLDFVMWGPFSDLTKIGRAHV